MSETCISAGIILLLVGMFIFFKMCEAGDNYRRIVRQDQFERELDQLEEECKPRTTGEL